MWWSGFQHFVGVFFYFYGMKGVEKLSRVLSYPNFWPNILHSYAVWPWLIFDFSVKISAEGYFKIPHFGSDSGLLLTFFYLLVFLFFLTIVFIFIFHFYSIFIFIFILYFYFHFTILFLFFSLITSLGFFINFFNESKNCQKYSVKVQKISSLVCHQSCQITLLTFSSKKSFKLHSIPIKNH